MATAWRLTPPLYARVFDGEGASLSGGRWNSRGVSMLYTSSHLSLCVLEVFVHLPQVLRLNIPDFEVVHLTIPDDAGTKHISAVELETMLAAPEPLATCRAVGDGWIASGRDLVLAAPSVVVPEELNLMLNPAHPRMRDVAIVSTRRFRFDARLSTAPR
jgi:RES domain-containing protein